VKYYYLKLGAGNQEAELRLNQKPPNAAVFFDDLSEADYKRGLGKTQSRVFWQRGHSKLRDATIMVVISNGRLRLLKPAGKVEFSRPYSLPDGTRFTTKEMPVEILRELWCKDVPPVLAGVACSQYHGRRTFTEIGNWGNLKAIDYVLGRLKVGVLPTGAHWNLKHQTAAQLLECLGSTELETLVGKLFEANGCHVPAYLGGTLKDIDIFAYNDRSSPVTVGGISILPRERISIQVKGWSGLTCPQAVDYLIGLDAQPNPKTFNAEWLLSAVLQTPPVLAWMKRSLDWLPTKFLQEFDL
jgi:hypothetical protein